MLLIGTEKKLKLGTKLLSVVVVVLSLKNEKTYSDFLLLHVIGNWVNKMTVFVHSFSFFIVFLLAGPSSRTLAAFFHSFIHTKG